MVVGALGAGCAVSLVRFIAPEATGSGIPHLKAVLARLRSLRWHVVLPVKFVGGALGIGSGLALGREGPTVQMGGAMGAAVSQWLKVTPRERQTLIAAGAGAGLAAAFNALPGSNGEIIAHVTFFLLWHIPDYVTYAAPGQQYVIDMQVVMSHPALNLRSIMLLSFRASHAGEQHADYLLEDATDLGALSLRPRWSPS
jgi:hypothetical protein